MHLSSTGFKQACYHQSAGNALLTDFVASLQINHLAKAILT